MPGIASQGATKSAQMGLNVNQYATDAKISAIGTQTKAISSIIENLSGLATSSDLGSGPGTDSSIGSYGDETPIANVGS